MRWNVVIGGQLFSKSFLGYTTYKMAWATREGLLPAVLLLILPFVILAVLIRLLPPWETRQRGPGPLLILQPQQPAAPVVGDGEVLVARVIALQEGPDRRAQPV